MITTKTAIAAPEPDPKRQRATFNAVELAAYLGVSRATVWRLHASGKLPSPLRLNRAVRWDHWTIDEWLAAGAPPRDKWEETRKDR
jgi:predicted DNA-binding transcriptional regulator AlpA